MKHPVERIEEALIEHFETLKEGITLPEVWRVTFPVDIHALKYMSNAGLLVWFHSYTLARKLGMWWTYRDDGPQSYVTLHGTRGTAPVVDNLRELVMWTYAEAEALVEVRDGKITSKNFSLLTTPTEPYSY